MTTITYPNGQTLTSTALTPQQISVIVQKLTCGMLGITPVDPSKVRVDWQTEGQPDVARPSQDVCYVSCVPHKTNYGTRDVSNAGTTEVTQTWVYTRGWRVAWEQYGPNSFDRNRQVASALFQDYFTDQFELQGKLYPILEDDNEPSRSPELHNAQWYERSDFHCNFYEEVTETIQYPSVSSVEILVETSVGQIADITFTKA